MEDELIYANVLSIGNGNMCCVGSDIGETS